MCHALRIEYIALLQVLVLFLESVGQMYGAEMCVCVCVCSLPFGFDGSCFLWFISRCYLDLLLLLLFHCSKWIGRGLRLRKLHLGGDSVFNTQKEGRKGEGERTEATHKNSQTRGRGRRHIQRMPQQYLLVDFLRLYPRTAQHDVCEIDLRLYLYLCRQSHENETRFLCCYPSLPSL